MINFINQINGILLLYLCVCVCVLDFYSGDQDTILLHIAHSQPFSSQQHGCEIQ